MNQLPSFQLSFPQAENDIALQCDSALKIVIEAQKVGVLDAPATSLTDFGTETNVDVKLSDLNPVRFHTIIKQLWLLGYVNEKPRRNVSSKHQNNQEFKAAVRRFQRDAGIVKDGWLGNQTWKTLQELVSFETPIDTRSWLLPNGKYRTAFNRALQLRMWTYGFIEKKPSYNFAGLTQKTLLRAARLIQVLHATDEGELTDWRSVLLDADKMLAGVIGVISKPNLVSLPDKQSIRRLIISTARVELWLLGFDVWINNADDFQVESYGVKRVKIRRAKRKVWSHATNHKLKQGLWQFWFKLMGRSEEDINERSLASSLSLAFFIALQNPEIESTNADYFDQPDFSQQAVEQLKTTRDIENGYSRYRSLGMKLWDGVKRIWRWFVRGVKNIIKLADNLIRGFFRLATKSYIILRKALITLTSSTRQYVNGRLDKTGKHVILVSKDFDYKSVVHESEDPILAINSIRRFSAGFLFSCKVVGLIVDVLTKAVQGIIGWARFLYVLVKHYRVIALAYSELKLQN